MSFFIFRVLQLWTLTGSLHLFMCGPSFLSTPPWLPPCPYHVELTLAVPLIVWAGALLAGFSPSLASLLEIRTQSEFCPMLRTLSYKFTLSGLQVGLGMTQAPSGFTQSH